MEKKPSRKIPEETAATPVEINQAIDTLRPAELLRLRKCAQFRIKGLGRASQGRNAEDLLYEALNATLRGNRQWNTSVSFPVHLLGAMRSISSHWKEQFDDAEALLEAEVISTTSAGEAYNPYVNARSTNPGSERIVAAKQEVEAIEQLLADDPLALEIIGGWRAEMTGPEIQEALGLTKTAYETTVKRLRRKIQSFLSQREHGAWERPTMTTAGVTPSMIPRGENRV
jgi:hypothetical protein